MRESTKNQDLTVNLFAEVSILPKNDPRVDTHLLVVGLRKENRLNAKFETKPLCPQCLSAQTQRLICHRNKC